MDLRRLDPAKHKLNHAAGLKGQDAGLNLWNPEYFHISGAFHPHSLTDPRAAVTAEVGQTILARITNGGYFPQRITFGGLEAEVIGSDSRPFPDGRSFKTKSLLVGSAERYMLLLRPTSPGTYVVRLEHVHWITGKTVGFADTTVTVTEPGQAPRPPGAEPGTPVLIPGSPPQSSQGPSASATEAGAGAVAGAPSARSPSATGASRRP